MHKSLNWIRFLVGRWKFHPLYELCHSVATPLGPVETPKRYLQFPSSPDIADTVYTWSMLRRVCFACPCCMQRNLTRMRFLVGWWKFHPQYNFCDNSASTRTWWDLRKTSWKYFFSVHHWFNTPTWQTLRTTNVLLGPSRSYSDCDGVTNVDIQKYLVFNVIRLHYMDHISMCQN